MGALAAGLALAAGCSTSSRSGTEAAAPVSIALPASVNTILAQMESEPSARGATIAEHVEMFQTLAMADDWRESLRVYDLSEAEFIRLPEAERNRLRAIYITRGGTMKTLAYAALDEAVRLRRQGEPGSAEVLLESVRRFTLANTTPETLAVGKMIAEAIAGKAVAIQSQ